MSKNNQLLVKEYKGKFYIFEVMAETWGGFDGYPVNQLYIKEGKGPYDTRDQAHAVAHRIEREDEWFGSEYGVIDETLFKDGAEVHVVE